MPMETHRGILVIACGALGREIAALRRAGHNREADEELRRFRGAYPGYFVSARP